ncbi:MAG TPA: hypothetical protein VM658_01645 [bacterium]|nr:hypothetical protein [bacterium]
MKRTRSVIVAAMLAALWLGPPASWGADGPNFSYRFLWPADAAKPGQDLVELLPAAEASVKEIETVLGPVKTKALVLKLPSGTAALDALVYPVPGRDDATVIETTTRLEINAPTGDYFKPAFAAPAIKAPDGYGRVLTFKVDAFSPYSLKPVATSGPIILYNDSLDAIVISPLDNFLAAMQAPVRGEWLCGFGGMIEKIPAGTTHQVLVVSGHGINATILKWGDVLRAWHQHQRPDAYADVGLKYLGYWTDNGAYYYYKTEKGMNYHDTLLAVKQDADAKGIPFGYFQLDSWWYPKARTNNLLNAFRGGSLLWEPIPELFPEGLPAFQQALGLPLEAHNRWYNQDSPYCARYQCVYGTGSKRPALPIDPKFWDEIMDNAVSYGVQVYEQDWLVTQMNMIPWLRDGLHNAESWFDSMADTASARGLTMQLCMASPEFFLQQIKHDNITQVRCSDDYQAGILKDYYWPNFHTTSMFAYAVGLWPFKDNFQSAPGQRPVRSEKWPLEEALISVLSAGVVGPSDRIGYADPELLMRTCRKDGVLLKPDRPATPIDLMFLDNKKPWIVTTGSKHDIGETVYLAGFNIRPASMRDPSVSLADLGLSGKYMVYNWRTRELELDADKIAFGRMPQNNGFYYVLCPMLGNGMAVIGETGKFVTLSVMRFPKISYAAGMVSIDVAGVPGEEVKVSIYLPCPPRKISGCMIPGALEGISEGVMTTTVVIPDEGRTTITVE